jgi:cytidylate kinase
MPTTAKIPRTITIDGPAAAGKSALGERLAERLGYLFFDTGVLYRAIAYLALQQGIAPSDEAGLTRLAQEANIVISRPTVDDGRQYTVLVEGEDVTWRLRHLDVERIVSPVAAVKGVREALRQRQRAIGLAGHVVMVGRDIGTVVLPEADLKIFLTASLEERARRRYREVAARGDAADYEQILASMRQRDEIDSQRAVAPLKPAADAVIINNDELSIDEGVALVESIIERRAAGQATGGDT